MSARDLLHDMLAAGFTLDVSNDKLLVAPASALTDDMRKSLRACKSELIEMLAVTEMRDGGRPAKTGARQEPVSALTLAEMGITKRCTDCRHLSRVNTCGQPVAAGLLTKAEGYGIAWPPAAHASSCPAFSGNAPSTAQDRPYRLTPAQGDAAHAEAWDDASIARFQARVQRLVRLGIAADDADDLAERLHLRDVAVDDRVLCLECSHYRPGRCGNYRRAGLHAPELSPVMAVTLQRCGGAHAC